MQFVAWPTWLPIPHALPPGRGRRGSIWCEGSSVRAVSFGRRWRHLELVSIAQLNTNDGNDLLRMPATVCENDIAATFRWRVLRPDGALSTFGGVGRLPGNLRDGVVTL